MKFQKELIFYPVIFTLIFIIILLVIEFNANSFKFNPDNFWTFFGTLGGAFLGAWLAGKYAVDVAKMTIKESKLWNYEDFRKLLLVYKKNLMRVHDSSHMIANGNLDAGDMESFVREINHHSRMVEEIDLSKTPADYHNKIELIRRYVYQLTNYAALKNIEIEGTIVYDADHVKKLNDSYKKLIDDLFEELKI